MRCRRSSSASRWRRTSRGATSASTRSPCGSPTAPWTQSRARSRTSRRAACARCTSARSSTTRPGCCGSCATARGCASRSRRRRASGRSRRSRAARSAPSAPRGSARSCGCCCTSRSRRPCAALEGLKIGPQLLPGFRVDPDLVERAQRLTPVDARADLVALAACCLDAGATELAQRLDRLEFTARERDIVVAAATRARSLAPVMGGLDRPSALWALLRREAPETVALAGALGAPDAARRWLDDLRGTAPGDRRRRPARRRPLRPRGRPRARRCHGRGARRRGGRSRGAARRGARGAAGPSERQLRHGEGGGSGPPWRGCAMLGREYQRQLRTPGVRRAAAPPRAPSSMRVLKFDPPQCLRWTCPPPSARTATTSPPTSPAGSVLFSTRRGGVSPRPVRLAEPRAAHERQRRERRREPRAPRRCGRAAARALPLRPPGPRDDRAPRDRAAGARPAGGRGGRAGDGARRRRGARVHRRLPAGDARRRRRGRGAARRLARAGERDRGRGRRGAARARRRPAPITAALGPAARGCCYEVSEDVHATSRTTTRAWASATSTSPRSPGRSSRRPESRRSTTSGCARCAPTPVCSSPTAATAASPGARRGSCGGPDHRPRGRGGARGEPSGYARRSPRRRGRPGATRPRSSCSPPSSTSRSRSSA